MKTEILQTELDMTDGPMSQDNAESLKLQGECRISSLTPLKWSWIKFFLLIVPVVILLVPLLLLKYYKWFRVMVFFTEVSFAQATALYVEGANDVDDIEFLINPDGDGPRLFYFKSLKYRLIRGKGYPIYFDIVGDYSLYCNKTHYGKGLDEKTVDIQLLKYGKNVHIVETPWYHEFMFDTMTKPFFLLQYFICIIWIFENLWIFSIVMIVFSVVTTSVNYYLLWTSFKKIKDIAERVFPVQVLRNGAMKEVMSDQLVVGDIFQPDHHLPCDSILINGEAYVNQSSLTGESVPIGKFPIDSPQSIKQSNRWLYEGAIVLEHRANAMALVINVGYATCRGRIIRKILTRVTKSPDFFKTVLLFLSESLLVGIILYLVTLPLMLRLDIVPQFIAFRVFDVMAWTFPPPLPIYFNLCYSFALGRLRGKGINGTQPEKTLESAKLKTFCFDKTGTLTENAVEVYEVIRFKNEDEYINITNQKEDPANAMVWKFFATCHTVKEINGQFLGDQVDLRMFLFTDYKMTVNDDPSIKFVVENNKGQRVQVLRINQFQSRFQSMSVLVKDFKSNKYFALLKGAPEKIQKNSTLKVKEFENLVARMSLGGYRTIGFGYKEILESQLNDFLTGPREQFESNIIPLGIVAFENKLKHDTRESILSLVQANIQPKMITGDNIFIAVETGVRSGIIEKGIPVVLLEGRKQKFIEGQRRVFKGMLVTRNQLNQAIQTPIELPEDGEEYLNQKYPIAIDNDFLTMDPEPYLPNQIKLFSRISPENKALVVRRLKEQTVKEYQSRSFRARFFGELPPKVGMCGDGANDLMAIREADVGLGISDSDASYGASFSIVNMMDVEEIIRDSKAAESNLIEMFQFFCSASWVKYIGYTLLMTDGTSINGFQAIWFNFICNIWLPILMALSKPSKGMNKYSPNSNFMGFSNHLVFWGNTLIPIAGLCTTYFYFTTTTDWSPNPIQIVTAKGYFPINKSNTIIFILLEIPFVWNSFFCYTSAPFKQRIWKNWPLMFLMVSNMILSIALFFISKYLVQELFLVELDNYIMITCLSIIFNFVFVQWLFNALVGKLELYKYTKLHQEQRVDLQGSGSGNQVHNVNRKFDQELEIM